MLGGSIQVLSRREEDTNLIDIQKSATLELTEGHTQSATIDPVGSPLGISTSP